MGATYTGVASNVSLASAVQTTVPLDGDNDNAATFTVGMQKADDYLEALRQAVVTGALFPFFEGFESVTFPPASPAGIWAAPSPRFGTDAAYVRDTNNPITGSASANRPGSQTATSVSSLGLSNITFPAPSRIAFVFDLLCNASFGDHLDFYIDGVLTGSWSCTTNTTVSAGRFMSDVLREGAHTFDWRFVRGGSASVANEKARFDAVNIIPESVWLDRATRSLTDEDFTSAIGGDVSFTTGANGGTNTQAVNDTLLGNGVYTITSAAIAAGDYEGVVFGVNSNSWRESLATYFPFIECFFELPSITNMYFQFGFVDNPGNIQNAALWVYDPLVGTDWRFKTITGGVATTNPTGILPVAATATRLGITGAGGLTNGNGWLGTINGKAVPGAGANHMGSTQNLPAVVMTPVMIVGSRIAAAAKSANLDYLRVMGFRQAGLIG